MTPRYSLTTGAAGELTPQRLAELAALAGWDAVFLEDYLVYQGHDEQPTWDPWTCLAAMAVATTRLKIGTTVTPLPRRRPWDLAAQVVSLDQLSGGRVVLGVGAGDGGDPGFSRVGGATTAAGRAADLDESLEVLAALMTGEPVHHRGPRHTLDGLRLAARPVQRPRVPIWVGGDLTVPGVRRRIARYDGCCAYKGSTDVDHPEITPDDVAALLAEVADVRGTTDGFDMKVGGDPDGWPALAAAGATWLGRWVSPLEPDAVLRAAEQGPPR
ncbi:LLM class flavin-dependent oxidoreductase [Angustibacter peucedani]